MEADFLAIYHRDIDLEEGDTAGMSGSRFIRLAEALPYYQGAVAARMMREHQEAVDVEDSSLEALASSPDLAGIVSVGRG